MSDIDPADYTATAILAINSDPGLKQSFQKILGPGTRPPEARVGSLLRALEKAGAPQEMKNFVKLLRDEKLANEVLKAISD